MILVVLGVLAIVGGVACVILEERRRPEIMVLIVLMITVFDVLVYPDGGLEPPGILRPTLLGHDYRTADLVIAAALVARLVVRGFPRRITGPGLLWSAFFAFFLLAAPLGLANGHDSVLVLFQTKFVLEAGGMAILVAGVPVERFVSRSFIAKSAWIVGLASLAPILAAAAGRDVSLPLLADSGFASRLGADTATVLLSLGFVLLIVELCNAAPRFGVVGWCGILILSPILSGQRAALIGMVVALLCAFVVVNGRPWRRRSRARLTQLLPLVACLAIPVGAGAILNARTSSTSASIPLVSSITQSFTGTGKNQSADIRLRVWDTGRKLIEQRPLFGWGLGQDFNIFQNNGSEDPFTGGDFHNIAIDLGVTTGFAGIALFGLALLGSLWDSFTVWRGARDPAIAAVALASGILLTQLVAKGLFESVTQKYRLALIFGLFIGLVAGAARVRQAELAEAAEVASLESVWI